MRGLRVLAAEDEEAARRLLGRYLAQIPEVAVFELAADGETALERLSNEKWDVVLLDIEMAGVDGLYLMNYIDSLAHKPAIIFTTAYGEHAVAAFAGGAVDYLLKPFSLDRLKQAFTRVQRYLVTTAGGSDSRFAFLSGDRYVVVSLSDIVAIFLEEGTLILEAGDRTLYTVRALALKEIEERLPSPPFLRIARQTIVNIDAIQEVIPWFSGRYKLLMKTERVYYCSRENVSALRKALGLSQ